MLNSYGVVLWEMSTRKVPYKGISNAMIIDCVANKKHKLKVPDLYPDNISTVMKSKYDLLISFSLYLPHTCI